MKYLGRNATPKRLGTSRLLYEIGRGGIGQVYAAVDEISELEVAIKILALGGLNRVNRVKRFQREAKTGGYLEHPNNVPILEYAEQNDLVYLVMPRIGGTDLGELTSRRCDENKENGCALPVVACHQVAEIGLQVASALVHSHSQGYVHRDIKPANIMLEANGHVWVTDFGLVKTSDLDRSLSRPGDIIGTPRYMAPEQLRGSCDGRSDIYSLEITLYELATGRRASSKSKGRSRPCGSYSMELVPTREISVDVPTGLSAIITRCCALNPEDRYQSASELQFVIQRFIQGESDGDRRKMSNRNRHATKRRYLRLVSAFLWILVAVGCLAIELRYAQALLSNSVSTTGARSQKYCLQDTFLHDFWIDVHA